MMLIHCQLEYAACPHLVAYKAIWLLKCKSSSLICVLMKLGSQLKMPVNYFN